MRAVIQRVSQAQVDVDDRLVGAIGHGLLVLLGVHVNDAEKDVKWMADKVVNLRIFEDDQGLMNRSLLDIGGEMLIVSQFTLVGDCRKGRRPSWSSAAPPEPADTLYNNFVAAVDKHGIRTATGRFQAMMDVTLVNQGPVTILLDSHKTF
ncbi:MAG: D-tyrosyl-tRNA(Tyr) deacylase [Desulfobulbaceae bacterium]|nr:D-tyrosyl-tRNA(Tyr) deacylase [Desulfobulbaceae bacterium]